jgi:7-carboxy-7-deazaguanine synthase
LACGYCDSKYAQNPKSGKEMAVDEVAQEIIKFYEQSKCNLVEITGGEPLLQMEEVIELCEMLKTEIDAHILIETNGSVNLENINLSAEYTTMVMDIKCPSSGMSERNFYPNLGMLSITDEVKFVVGSQEDLEFMSNILKKYPTKAQVLVSPVWETIPWVQIAEYIKMNHPDIKMQIQMHKIIWEPMARGV